VRPFPAAAKIMTFVRLPVESNLLSIVREDSVSETHKGKPDSKGQREAKLHLLAFVA